MTNKYDKLLEQKSKNSTKNNLDKVKITNIEKDEIIEKLNQEIKKYIDIQIIDKNQINKLKEEIENLNKKNNEGNKIMNEKNSLLIKDIENINNELNKNIEETDTIKPNPDIKVVEIMNKNQKVINELKIEFSNIKNEKSKLLKELNELKLKNDKFKNLQNQFENLQNYVSIYVQS